MLFKEQALIYFVFGAFLFQLAMLGHVLCSAKKTTLPTIVWIAICLAIPFVGYVFWLLEKDQSG
jgi:hypothetical protein